MPQSKSTQVAHKPCYYHLMEKEFVPLSLSHPSWKSGMLIIIDQDIKSLKIDKFEAQNTFGMGYFVNAKTYLNAMGLEAPVSTRPILVTPGPFAVPSYMPAGTIIEKIKN